MGESGSSHVRLTLHSVARAQNYLESVSWSVIMIVISNLVMSIVKREPSGFRITVKQPIATVC